METLAVSKYQRLSSRLKELNKVVIGFSGGVDSSLLLKAAVDTLGGENVWAVTGDSESLMPEELELCRKLADQIGLKPENFIVIKTNELSDPNYRANPVDRCFFCKTELFGRLQDVARRVGAKYVLDGSNADDLHDWRPGRRAAADLDVVSPLAEIGITKEDIRRMGREMGLPNWEKPSLACLASRIPYGSEVTVEKLNRVAGAERFLSSLGFKQFRVRHHDKIARIELLKSDFPRLFEEDIQSKIIAGIKTLGFTYVTIDLEGYRTGSMNENQDKEIKR